MYPSRHVIEKSTCVVQLLSCDDCAVTTQVYTRLAKLVSHVASTRLMKMLSEGYNNQVLEWRDVHQTGVQAQAQYILVGDNADKNIAP